MVRNVRLALLSVIFVAGLASMSAAAQTTTKTDDKAFSPKQLRLVRGRRGFFLSFISGAKRKRVPIPREWLVPPAEEKAEEENYVSSFDYSREVSSFPVGNSEIGLHISSYAVADEGSSGAAAGRDIFLILDPRSLVLRQGLMGLGVTKERFRDTGCFRAKVSHFLTADINRDGLTDIGIVREEIECSSYHQHPINWYVFREGAWRLDSTHSGIWPREWSELPLLGITLTPVDFVGYLTWHSYDSAGWAAGDKATKKIRPEFIPRYRRKLMQDALAPKKP